MPKANDRFAEVLCGKLANAGFFHKDMAKRLGISEAAFGYKLKDPDKFTFREIKIIFRVLNYSSDDKERCFR